VKTLKTSCRGSSGLPKRALSIDFVPFFSLILGTEVSRLSSTGGCFQPQGGLCEFARCGCQVKANTSRCNRVPQLKICESVSSDYNTPGPSQPCTVDLSPYTSTLLRLGQSYLASFYDAGMPINQTGDRFLQSSRVDRDEVPF